MDQQVAGLLRAVADVVFRIGLAGLLRYVVIVGVTFLLVVGVCILLGRGKIQGKWPRRDQIIRELAGSVASIAIFAGLLTIEVQLGLVRIAPAGSYGFLEIVLLTLVLLLVHDTFFYWTHRLLHTRPMMRFHRFHHRSRAPTVLTAYAFHPVEAVINGLVFTPVALFTPLYPESFTAFMLIMIARNAIGHSGYEIFPRTRAGEPVWDWMTTVTHHDLHHEFSRGNFGLYFTFWDRIMGTEDPVYRERFELNSKGRQNPVQ